MRPPWHEWSPSAVEQSISCCSDRETSLPFLMKLAPSVEPVVENDQHEPHWPWFLTGVTAPLVRQSTESAAPETDTVLGRTSMFSATRGSILGPTSIALTSSCVRSEYSLAPLVRRH